MLYLHEIIDIVGTGQQSYLATVLERARHSEQEGISRLMGTWKRWFSAWLIRSLMIIRPPVSAQAGDLQEEPDGYLNAC